MYPSPQSDSRSSSWADPAAPVVGRLSREERLQFHSDAAADNNELLHLFVSDDSELQFHPIPMLIRDVESILINDQITDHCCKRAAVGLSDYIY
jgi:hypothetical protein